MSEYLQGGKVLDCSGIKQRVILPDGTETYSNSCSRKRCPCREFELRLRK